MNMQKKKTLSFLYLIFGLLSVAGVIMAIIGKEYAYIPFSIGTLIMVILRIATFRRSEDFRIKRLQNMQIISSLLLVLTAYLMFRGQNAWAITLIISAIFDLVSNIRMPSD